MEETVSLDPPPAGEFTDMEVWDAAAEVVNSQLGDIEYLSVVEITHDLLVKDSRYLAMSQAERDKLYGDVNETASGILKELKEALEDAGKALALVAAASDVAD